MKKVFISILILGVSLPLSVFALLFNGVLDNVDSANPSGSLNITGAITITAWVYATSLAGTFETIVTKGKTSTAEGDVDRSPYSLIARNGIPRFWIVDSLNAGSASDASSAMAINRWNFVAATWDGTTGTNDVCVYLNLVQTCYTQTTVSAMKTNTRDLAIGNDIVRKDATNRMSWKGSISDVRIYNRALSQNELRQVYYGQAVNIGLVGRWNLLAQSLSFEPDSSGNGNYGTTTANIVRGSLSPALRFRR